MVNQANRVFNDARHDLRIKENRRVSWHVRDVNIKGQGKVKNISTTGMLLETNGNFKPADHCVFSFDSDLGYRNFIPQRGELVWHKRKSFAQNRYLCGIRFVEPSDFVLTRLRERVQKGILYFTGLRRVQYVSNTVLIFAIVGLMGYAMYLSSTIYDDMQKTNVNMVAVANQQAFLSREYTLQLSNAKDELYKTRALYIESEGTIASVTRELEATKAILIQTESMLKEVRTNNSQLKNEAQSIKDLSSAELSKTRTELENKIATLEKQQTELKTEVSGLQEKIAYYEGNVKNTAEGTRLLNTYRSNIKLVKSKIRTFRKEAELTRRAALKERDRIRLLLGNNGYLIRDGRAVIVDEKNYNEATLEGLEKPATSPAKNVEIDVTFVD